jgi:4-hydroxy-tetrahydrodipicolinate synthase
MFGIIAAVPTPINNDGHPIPDLFLSHCSWVLENGCDGINVLGSTGEANSFNTRHRKFIMETAASNLDLEKLMVGTGTPSLLETINLTQLADSLGYKVALVLPPYYYKPVNNSGLFEWYKSLHENLRNRKIKIFFYNFPQMTGLTIPIEVIQRLHKLWPARFCGIKDSSGDLTYCRKLSLNEDFKVFPSSEVSLSEAHTSNFAGCISATTNQTLFLCAEAWKNKNLEINSLIAKIRLIRERISAESLIPSIKYLVAKRTENEEWSKLLPPLGELSKSRKNELDIVFKELN